MNLEIPFHAQKIEGFEGVYVLQNLMEFFERDVSLDAIIHETKTGTRLQNDSEAAFLLELGIAANSFGFKSIVYSMDMSLFTPKESELKGQDFLKFLKEMHGVHSGRKKRVIENIALLLQGEGEFKIKIPGIEEVEALIDEKIPVIVSVIDGLVTNRNKTSGRYLIVHGYSPDYFNCTDIKLGEIRIKKENLFMALQANSIHVSSYMLAIKPSYTSAKVLSKKPIDKVIDNIKW